MSQTHLVLFAVPFEIASQLYLDEHGTPDSVELSPPLLAFNEHHFAQLFDQLLGQYQSDQSKAQLPLLLQFQAPLRLLFLELPQIKRLQRLEDFDFAPLQVAFFLVLLDLLNLTIVDVLEPFPLLFVLLFRLLEVQIFLCGLLHRVREVGQQVSRFQHVFLANRIERGFNSNRWRNRSRQRANTEVEGFIHVDQWELYFAGRLGYCLVLIPGRYDSA